MANLNDYAGRVNLAVGAGISGFVLATTSYKVLGEAAACGAFERNGWVAGEVWRLVILVADWQGVAACFCAGARLLGSLLQVGATVFGF